MIITKYWTDKNQSDRLIELGLNPDTADLYITPKVGGYVYSTEKCSNSTPAWSLYKLVEIINDGSDRDVSIDFRDETVDLWRFGVKETEFYLGDSLMNNVVNCIFYLIKVNGIKL